VCAVLAGRTWAPARRPPKARRRLRRRCSSAARQASGRPARPRSCAALSGLTSWRSTPATRAARCGLAAALTHSALPRRLTVASAAHVGRVGREDWTERQVRQHGEGDGHQLRGQLRRHGEEAGANHGRGRRHVRRRPRRRAGPHQQHQGTLRAGSSSAAHCTRSAVAVADARTATQASKIPIICICNDKWSQKLKSLQNHCQEFAFHRPTKQQIRNRLLQIAQQEGLKARAWRSQWLLVSA
jgi:hypothetical protein